MEWMPRSPAALGPLPDQLPVGSDSLSWHIAREPALLLGGGRALLLQVTHPLVAAGVDQHSNYQADPWSRLFSTLDTVMTMMFGSPAASTRAAERLKRRHRTVNGVTDDGTAYDALDADLQLWVWATLVDTAIVVHERTLGRLSSALKARYLDEQKLLAYACGVPAGHCPERYPDFVDYVETVTHDTLAATKVAREVAHQLREPPLPTALRVAAGPPLGLVTAGLLPDHLRSPLGFDWGPRQERALKAVFLAAHAQRAVPGAIRRLPVSLAAKRDTPLQPPRWLRGVA
jgi:uncharacterized protein (DUF2236 family)